VIDFLYTGSIRLSLDDIPDVLRLADFLRIGRLLEICSTHLSSRVDRSNAVAVRHLVDTYNLSAISPRLAADVGDLVSRNLPSIVRSFGRRRRLCRRFPPETIVRLLNDDEIGSVRERDIYDAVCHYATVSEDRQLLEAARRPP
jgi:hypothetical protein